MNIKITIYYLNKVCFPFQCSHTVYVVCIDYELNHIVTLFTMLSILPKLAMCILFHSQFL